MIPESYCRPQYAEEFLNDDELKFASRSGDRYWSETEYSSRDLVLTMMISWALGDVKLP